MFIYQYEQCSQKNCTTDKPSLSNVMPSRKKKSKAKGRKPVAGKGGAKGADNAAAGEQQKQGTLDSEMQRLRIGQQEGDDEDDALLEQAIKLAAVEQLEIEENKKENCTHGYNPSSRFQARFCEDFLKAFTDAYHSAVTLRLREDDGIYAPLNSVIDAFRTAVKSFSSTGALRNKSNVERVIPCCLAEGTKKFILDENYADARLCAALALFTKYAHTDEPTLLDQQRMLELLYGDEHTLVRFFRKQIPCSCLDEKYNEVKSVTKMGICYNDDCPLPGHMAVRSKMLRCTGCLNDHYVSYCSRECQEADWPSHKKFCGKTAKEVSAMRSNE
jgi:hypothetical protein